MITIAIGVDHRGIMLKDFLLEHKMRHEGEDIRWIDVGCENRSYCDYPEFAALACEQVLSGVAQRAVLICGTGVGMAIMANRFAGIYAALVWNEELARLAIEHDKVNVLVLPADYVESEQAASMIDAWLSAEFLGGKYQRRIDMIDAIK